MNPKYLKFTTAVSGLRLTGPDRSFAIAAAVASSVADFSEIPATPSDTPNSAYLNMAAMAIRGAVGAFNEASPFDVRLALDLARKFWMLRYETLHVRRIHDADADNYFFGYMNVKRNFSEDEICCLNKHSKEINILEIYVREILQNLRRTSEVDQVRSGDAVPSEPSQVV